MPFERMTDTSFADAMDIVAVLGAPGIAGPGTAWFRLRVPVVAGEEMTPLQRVAAAADFGNGISSVVDWDDGWLFINPDLTVYLHRYPVGEWVGLEATTYPGDSGPDSPRPRCTTSRAASAARSRASCSTVPEPVARDDRAARSSDATGISDI